MKLKGDYNASVTYAVGDIVRYTDGIWYHLQREVKKGTPPSDTRYWGQKDPCQNELLSLMMDVLGFDTNQSAEVKRSLNARFPNIYTVELQSSTPGSDKCMYIRAYDDGTITATDVEEVIDVEPAG